MHKIIAAAAILFLLSAKTCFNNYDMVDFQNALDAVMETFSNNGSEEIDNAVTPRNTQKTEIVLVRQYENYAWGYQNNGIIIDISGNAYAFDFSDMGFRDLNFTEELEKLYYSTDAEPVYFYDADTVENIRTLGLAIDDNAEITEKHIAYDAGQTTLYAYNSGKMNVICSDGDFYKENTDKNAVKIRNMCKKSGIWSQFF